MEMPAEFTTGERIRHLRERRGMTRVVLANLVGYSADWLKRIEAGQRGVSIPALVRLARVLRVDDLDGPERRTASRFLASAYGLAQHLAVDLVEPETGRIIADRAARASQTADDPVALAFGAWTQGHVLRSVDADAALRIVAEAAVELEQHMDGPDAIGLYGSLCLHMGISAAYQGDDGNAWRFWDTADEVARALPVGYFHPQTIFGQANVDIHGVSIAAELRRFGEAVSRADRINLEQVPSRERRGRLYGEIAAGHMQRRELEQARHFLERSYAESPEEAPYSPLTRGVAVELVRTATGSLKTEAVALAERMGNPSGGLTAELAKAASRPRGNALVAPGGGTGRAAR